MTIMDLEAYIQIPDLDAVAEANGIRVSRLRGYRLIRDCRRYTEDEMREDENHTRIHAYERIMASAPPFTLNPKCYGWDARTRRRERKYLIKDKDGHTIGIRMDLLHGKKRKAAKYEIKRFLRLQKTQSGLWNKYAGREDVLYIHARLGSWNWSSETWRDYKRNPWFLDGCDDTYDPSYCDIYARIDPSTVPEIEEGKEGAWQQV